MKLLERLFQTPKLRVVCPGGWVGEDTSTDRLTANWLLEFLAPRLNGAGDFGDLPEAALYVIREFGVEVRMGEAAVKRYGVTPIARFCSYSVAGVPPAIMGIGPVEAIPRALKAAGIGKEALDWIELNEAFAAQAIAVMKQLDLDPAKINPQGGAIALGHPLGATGVIRAATLMSGFQRTSARYGMISMCIGTGMGAAGVFERL